MYSGINEDSIENACTSLNTIIYVDQSFSSSGDGSSWNYPYKLLSQAVNAAASNPQCEAIYVAEGVYKTTNSQNPDVSFVLGDVNIYGGFPAGGSSFTERDWHKYETILSGDLDNDDTGGPIIENYSDINGVNSKTIMYLPPSSFNREINGFIFTGGQSQNNSTNDKENFGGAIYIDDCDFQINHCKFYGNEAHTGGAIYTRNSCGYYSNNLWVGNHAYNEGGGILLRGTSGSCNSIMYNCSFTENVADVDGAAILCHAHDLTVHNSIIWDATIANVLGVNGTGSFNINDSNIKGTWIGSSNNNIDVDPNFIDATIGNLRLQSTSPCIDVGNNNVAIGGVDLARNPRIINNTVDMGAYERSCPLDNIIYVDQSATGANTGLSWTDAYVSISDAIQKIDSCVAELKHIYVAEGVYKPSNTNDPTESFILGNASLYGGFPSGGSPFNMRDWSIYKTILSGDIDDNDNQLPICYHYTDIVGSNSKTIITMVDNSFVNEINGFILTAGRSDYQTGQSANVAGGAIHSNLSDFQVKNCKFYGNTANRGGAIYLMNNSQLQISNSILSGNFCRQLNGGGAMSINTYTEIINCSMTDNHAQETYNDNTLAGGGSPLGGSNAIIRNSIIYDNNNVIENGYYDIYNSCIKGTWTGINTNNISSFPYFIDPTIGDLRLSSASPCIDTGDNSFSSDLFDLDNNQRIIGPIIDMGAYENLCSNSFPEIASLGSLFEGLNGDSWTNQTANPPIQPWFEDCDPCGIVDGTPWFGLTCNSTNQITSIILSNNNLFGYLTNKIADFSELINLYLDNNQIYGNIPWDIGTLTKLQNLWLHYNQMSGNIPYSMENINSIIRIYLYNNNFNGAIPHTFGDLPNLQVLRVYNNNLSGCYIENLSKLCDQLTIHSTNANISAINNFDSNWEDFCECGAGFCPCNDVNSWIGGVGDWDIPTNWSLGHVPRACEDVLISQAGDDCTMPVNYSSVIYSLEVQLGAVLSIPSTARFTVITDVLDSTWNDCTNH